MHILLHEVLSQNGGSARAVAKIWRNKPVCNLCEDKLHFVPVASKELTWDCKRKKKELSVVIFNSSLVYCLFFRVFPNKVIRLKLICV